MMSPIDAFVVQAAYCTSNDAPVTAAIVNALADGLDVSTMTGARVLGWPGNPVSDALPLRLAGGIHYLWRAGAVPDLADLFAGAGAVHDNARAMAAVVRRHDAVLRPWLDGPPQTNEPGRSAPLMVGLLTGVARHGPRMEVLEIGSSAGLNLLIDRYRIALPGIATGPSDSPVQITPEWRGPPPPGQAPQIMSIRGVDIAPVDATDPAQAERLLAYVWADHAQRFDRMAHALALLRAHRPWLDAGDAADWVEARLAEPQPPGTTRVLMHSVVWQYLGDARQQRITSAMAAAGARATHDRPLAWVCVEADRSVDQHDVTIRSWPGFGDVTRIGHAHAHGFWIEHLRN